jgi:uncharacterized protein (TIGR02246 family)
MPRSAAAAALIARIVAADEHLDAAAFVEVLTPDASFVFAGNAAAVGRDAVRRSVEALFANLSTLKHTIHESWESDAMLVYEADVSYTFRSGANLRVPYVNVLRLAGGSVADYRIYLDPTELNATLARGAA